MMKLSHLSVFISLSVMSLASYASNSASDDGMQQNSSSKAEHLVPTQGSASAPNWVGVCNGGEPQLLAGCLTNSVRLSHSPIGVYVNSMWQGINTTANSTPNTVYIRKFPPGYALSANSGRGLTYNATGIPSSSKAWCSTDAISETGVSLDCNINNNPNSSTNTNCIYNVTAYAKGILSGGVITQNILQSTPGAGTALPLAIPIYVVCIGANRTTGEPASIEGIFVH